MVRALSWVHKTWDIVSRGCPVREYWPAWAGPTSWKDSLLDATSEKLGGKLTRCACLMPLTSDVHHIKVDEKAGICILTGVSGGRTVTHLFSSTISWRYLLQEFLYPRLSDRKHLFQ